MPSSASTSQIHDIGYRHYDGPRLGRGYVVRSLYVHNLRSSFGLGRSIKSKIFPFLLLGLMLIPAAGDIAVVAISGRHSALFEYALYFTYVQPLIALFLASQAPVLAAREQRSNTLPLYFSRPVTRLDFVLAKLGAMTSALLLITAAPVLLLYVGSILTKAPDPGAQVGRALAALVGCLLLSLVLAGLGLAIAAWAPRRGFGIVAVMASYLISNVFVVTLSAVASTKGHDTLEAWLGMFTPFTLVDIVQINLLGAKDVDSLAAVGVGGGAVALVAALALVAICLGALALRFRKAGR